MDDLNQLRGRRQQQNPPDSLVKILDHLQTGVDLARTTRGLQKDVQKVYPEVSAFLRKEENRIPSWVYTFLGVLAVAWSLTRKK